MESHDNSFGSVERKTASSNLKKRVEKKLDVYGIINGEFVKLAINKERVLYLDNQTFIFKNHNRKYPSLLYTALDKGDTKLIEFLADQGADLNVIQPGRKPLLFEIMLSKKIRNRFSLARKLINAGADVNATDRTDGRTLLSMSFSYCNEKIAVFLVKNGANIYPTCPGNHCYGCSPLSKAIDNSMFKVIDLLIEKKIDVNVRICSRSTLPLHIAVFKGYIKISDRLLNEGADINAICPKFRGSALHMALDCNSLNDVQFLLNNLSIDVNIQKPTSRYTPLCTVDNFNLECLDPLLNANPDMNLVDRDNVLVVDRHSSGRKESIIKIKNHLVKLKAAGFYLCDRNLAYISGQEFNSFYNECCQEVDFMKKTTISPRSHINFHDVLFINERQLALGLESSNNHEISSSGFNTRFPLYAGMIEYKLGKAVQWMKLRTSLTTVVYDLFNNHLPSIIMEMIFKYFKVYELMKLHQYQEKINSIKSNKN